MFVRLITLGLYGILDNCVLGVLLSCVIVSSLHVSIGAMLCTKYAQKIVIVDNIIY